MCLAFAFHFGFFLGSHSNRSFTHLHWELAYEMKLVCRRREHTVEIYSRVSVDNKIGFAFFFFLYTFFFSFFTLCIHSHSSKFHFVQHLSKPSYHHHAVNLYTCVFCSSAHRTQHTFAHSMAKKKILKNKFRNERRMKFEREQLERSKKMENRREDCSKLENWENGQWWWWCVRTCARSMPSDSTVAPQQTGWAFWLDDSCLTMARARKKRELKKGIMVVMLTERKWFSTISVRSISVI